MNKERILALADLIEKQPHTTVDDAHGFTMGNWTHACGTPACIAGWAVFAENGSAKFESGEWVSSRAASYLELDRDDAVLLFEPDLRNPDEFEDDETDATDGWDEITPSQAAATLRRLAETGSVDWSAS